MKLAFATLGCPNWKLEQVAANAKALGFDGVELRGVAGEHVGPDEPPADRARIRALFGQHGVEIACIMGYTKFTVADSKQRADSVAAGVKYIGLARDLGCPVVRVFGGNMEGDDRDANIRRVAEALAELAPVAAQAGVRLAMETHDAWCEGRNLAAVLDRVSNPAVGVCWDVCNSFFTEPPETTLPFVKGRIYHVHFKDASRDAAGAVHSRLPGQGLVPLGRILTVLHASGYAGYLSFEWEKKWEPALEEPEVAFPHYAKFVSALLKEKGVPRG